VGVYVVDVRLAHDIAYARAELRDRQVAWVHVVNVTADEPQRAHRGWVHTPTTTTSARLTSRLLPTLTPWSTTTDRSRVCVAAEKTGEKRKERRKKKEAEKDTK
jgi:hypothetical protein